MNNLPGRDKALKEILRRGEELKERIWLFVEFWEPKGETKACVIDAMEELRDAIYLLEAEE